jgi:hypothetical protein
MISYAAIAILPQAACAHRRAMLCNVLYGACSALPACLACLLACLLLLESDHLGKLLGSGLSDAVQT